MVSVSQGRHRLVVGAAAGSRGQLYDLEADPREQNDLADEDPETLTRMKSLARNYLASPPAPWGAAPEIGLDEDELQHLRALGYSVGN